MGSVPPSVINDAVRLTMFVREDFGPEIFDDPERFDKVFGAGVFAKTDSRVLSVIRSSVENSPYRMWRCSKGMSS